MEETATGTQKYHEFIKRALQFLIAVCLLSFPFSYCYHSGSMFSCNLQFSTLFLPLFVHALDRKYMFLICNGILAFLAKNLKFRSSDAQQVTELPQILEEETAVQEDVASIGEYDDSPPDGAVAAEDQVLEKQDSEEMQTAGFVSENEGWEEDNDEDDNDKELDEGLAVEGTPAVEEVKDASVSTEELNKKFEEFIRKMKEELRIEAQQQLIAV